MAKKAVPEIFARFPESAKAFSELMAYVGSLRGCTMEEKKTCAHVVAGGAAFLGVHPRKAGLHLTIVLGRPIDSKRIAKCEKTSAKRYHIDLKVAAEDGLDDELKTWIAEAHERNLQTR